MTGGALMFFVGSLLAQGEAVEASPDEVIAPVSPPAPSPARRVLAPLIREAQEGVVLWHPETIRDGRLLVLEVEPSADCPEPRIRFSGRVYNSFPAGARRHAFVPVRLGIAPGPKPVHVICGRRAIAFNVETFAGDYPESRLSVDPRYTAKPPRRAAEEAAKIGAALAAGPAARLWRDPFVVPATGVITSPYGVRRTFNGKLNSRHRGLDYNGDIGDPVQAVNDGVVVLAAADYYFTGSAVFVAHGDDLYTMYFHLSRLDVATGDKVQRGQVLGAIGASGRVTGPHLHFGFKLAGTYLDPEDLFAYGESATDR